jgi:phosphocarrier protein HPr
MRDQAQANVADDCECADNIAPEGAVSRELTICNVKGLHARATAKFVQTVARFSSEVTVSRCGESVGGTSIMGILTLGAGNGSTIMVSAIGDDAEAVVQALADLVADKFGEGE